MADWLTAFSSATTSIPRSDCASASETSHTFDRRLAEVAKAYRPPTRELCLVTQALDVLAAQGIGFGGRAPREAAASNQALLEGVQATLRLFIQTLERFGVRRIEALGRRFDPHLHEAVMAVDDRSQPPGAVVQVVDEGYTIHNRLLRPARVVVTSSQNQKPQTADDNDLGSEWGSTSVY